MMSVAERVSDLLTRHGWPPATLIVVLLLAGALYVLYQDHREVQKKWEKLSRDSLEASLLATTQRKELQTTLTQNMAVQEGHLKLIKDMEQARLKQNQLDQQLTASAVQALRQIADKVDVQTQMDKPTQVLQLQSPSQQ